MTKAIIAAAILAIAATPALAQKTRHRPPVQCAPTQNNFSLMDMIFSTGPAPQANGCAPAIYEGGRFVGQDPDPNIRAELRRNSANEGYHFDTK